MRFVYGPVPSRRLGLSLGISPIPKKTCNYSCTYCQLGRTDHLTNTRQWFFEIGEIIAEVDEVIKGNPRFDVVTIVGEGEPTLYLGLGELIREIRTRTVKPIAVITNGALFYDPVVRSELSFADIVLPSMDAYDHASYEIINRPHGTLRWPAAFHGLKAFSKEYEGQLWLEIMLVKDVNDDDGVFNKYLTLLKELKYARLYLNTPVRPPAEIGIKPIEHHKMACATRMLGGISIELLQSEGFCSQIANNLEAVMSIIRRHPMNQYEIEAFLKARSCRDISAVLNELKHNDGVVSINYLGYDTYRFK